MQQSVFAVSALKHNAWPSLMQLCRSTDIELQERALSTVRAFISCSEKIAQKAATGGLANVMQEVLQMHSVSDESYQEVVSCAQEIIAVLQRTPVAS